MDIGSSEAADTRFRRQLVRSDVSIGKCVVVEVMCTWVKAAQVGRF